ncbi:MAG: SsrA-binding protein SmpB [Gammaproteobacteria bacterium]
MAKKPKNPEKKTSGSGTIALNKKARHDYSLGDRFEAGLVLQGWEVKSLRAGKGQITDTYIHLKDGEAWLLAANITPLLSASTHISPTPMRARKLLLHRKEIDRLIGQVERKGFSLVPTALFWKHGKIKLEIALAKGKQSHDKRASIKERDWQRDKQRLLKGR